MLKILLLDDNEDILEAISFVLSRKRMEVIALQDASELDGAITKHHPDLLLMDIALGNDFDGRDLCARVKRKADVPVILFSAQNFTMESIEKCGADAVMEKPFKLQQLYSLISKYCL